MPGGAHVCPECHAKYTAETRKESETDTKEASDDEDDHQSYEWFDVPLTTDQMRELYRRISETTSAVTHSIYTRRMI
jgi:hypothetical protein